MCNSIHSNPEIRNSEKGNHQSDGTTNNSSGQSVHEDNNLEFVEELRHGSPAAGQPSSSSLCNDDASHINGNAYGSICRSDGNATLASAIQKTTGNLNGSCIVIQDGFKGMDSHCSSQREAALTKFRLKRKDRCYEKKVRYQSRKRLAEQRPQVKGQFVCLVQSGPPATEADHGCP